MQSLFWLIRRRILPRLVTTRLGTTPLVTPLLAGALLALTVLGHPTAGQENQQGGPTGAPKTTGTAIEKIAAEDLRQFWNLKYGEAFRIFRELARGGDPVAMFNLGLLYEQGQGAPKNGQKTGEWIKKARKSGYKPGGPSRPLAPFPIRPEKSKS